MVDDFPSIPGLESLDVNFTQVSRRAGKTSESVIDLSQLGKLQQLHIRGSIWSDLQHTFTGNSDSIHTCILQGSLVLGNQSDAFLDRIASGLQHLFCYGVHLIIPLDTRFPTLRTLSLHQIIHGTGVFPFTNANIEFLALEADPVAMPDVLSQMDELIAMVLPHIGHSVETLSVRGTEKHCSDQFAAIHKMPKLKNVIFDSAEIHDS